MQLVIGLLIGGVLGWFGRDAVPLVRNALARRGSGSGTPPIRTAKSNDGEWEVRREGASEPLATFPTKAEAQSAGREQAKADETEHIIHRADDSIGEQHDYSSGDRPT